MIEELICENHILTSNYKYFLTEKWCNIESIGNFLRYGIKVVEYDSNNTLIDYKEVQDVFGSKSKMKKAIEILKKLEVTPTTLEDIILDNIN